MITEEAIKITKQENWSGAVLNITAEVGFKETAQLNMYNTMREEERRKHIELISQELTRRLMEKLYGKVYPA